MISLRRAGWLKKDRQRLDLVAVLFKISGEFLGHVLAFSFASPLQPACKHRVEIVMVDGLLFLAANAVEKS